MDGFDAGFDNVHVLVNSFGGYDTTYTATGIIHIVLSTGDKMDVAVHDGLPGIDAAVHPNVKTCHFGIGFKDQATFFL